MSWGVSQSSLGFLGSPNEKPSVLAVLREPGQSEFCSREAGAALAEAVP